MQGNTKLIFFDLDGTLIDGFEYIYQHLWDYFDVEKSQTREVLKQYLRKEITYEAWVANDVRLLQEAGATKATMLEAIGTLYPMKGAFEVLDILKKQGHKLFVLSGGMDLLIEAVFGEKAAIFDDIFINRYVFDEQGYIAKAIPTKYDMEHKATCLKDTAQKYSLSLQDCIFIGDNQNDLDAALVAGVSIAFNCKSDELAQAATHHVDSNDLRDILPFLP